MRRTIFAVFSLTLTLALLNGAIAAEGTATSTTAEPSELFTTLDLNHDEKLEFIEVLPQLERSGLGDSWDENRVLKQFDRDKNGELDEAEFMKFHSEVLGPKE